MTETPQNNFVQVEGNPQLPLGTLTTASYIPPNGKRSDGRKFKGLLIGIAAEAFLGLVQGFVCLVWPQFKIPEPVFYVISGLVVAYITGNVIQKKIEAKNGNGFWSNYIRQSEPLLDAADVAGIEKIVEERQQPTQPGPDAPKGA